MDSIKGLNVLIVEDDLLTQKITSSTLSKAPISMTIVNNGNEAIEELNSKSYDLVLMDVYMPVQDGLDTTRWIRDLEDQYFKDVPIFALTNFPSDEHGDEIKKSGMNEHLVKPITLQEFFEKAEMYSFRAGNKK
jgi:CheY-like chemotaxis protein